MQKDTSYLEHISHAINISGNLQLTRSVRRFVGDVIAVRCPVVRKWLGGDGHEVIHGGRVQCQALPHVLQASLVLQTGHGIVGQRVAVNCCSAVTCKR